MTNEEIARIAFNAGYNRAPDIARGGFIFEHRERAYTEWRQAFKLPDKNDAWNDRKEGFRAGMLKAMMLARIMMPTEDFERDVKEYMARFPQPAPSPEKDGDELRPNRDIRSAFSLLQDAMKRDRGYAWSWHCNIAVTIIDSIDVSHEKGNRAAQDVMQQVFEIDVTQFDEWKSFEKHWADDHEEQRVDAIFKDAEKSSDLYADVAAKLTKGLEEAGMRNRQPAALNAPYGQRDRTVADVVRERGIEALFSGADYTTRMNARRFREELIKLTPPTLTPWGHLMNDAVILLLERVK